MVQRGGKHGKATDEENYLLGDSLDGHSLSGEQGQTVYVKSIHWRKGCFTEEMSKTGK